MGRSRKVAKRGVAKLLAEHATESPATKLLREENAKLRRKVSVSQALADLVVEAVERAYENPPVLVLPPARRPSRALRDVEEEVAVCHVSDTQHGKETITFDSAICAERLMEYAARVCTLIDRKRSYCNVREARLYLGGDMVEGEGIFPGQAHLTDSGVLEQAARSAPAALARMTLAIGSAVDRLHVVCVSGNHGRAAPRSVGSHPLTNWDRVCYEVTRLLVLGPDREKPRHGGRITFDIADDFYAIDNVLGHSNLIVHGHQIRGGFAGMPWYGVGKRLAGWIDAIKDPWERLYFGHFHTMTSGRVNDREWYCNGTVESDNEYAREELAAAGIPMQRLQFFSAKHGVVSDHQIYLTAGLDRRRRVRKRA